MLINNRQSEQGQPEQTRERKRENRERAREQESKREGRKTGEWGESATCYVQLMMMMMRRPHARSRSVKK